MKKYKKVISIISILLITALLLGALAAFLTLPEKKKPETQQKQGTIADVLSLTKSTSLILKDLHDNYVREADKIMNQFQYDSIWRDPSAKEAKKLIADLKRLIAEHRKNFLGILQELSHNFQTLKLSEKDRRFLEKEALPTAAILHDRMIARWDSELLIVNLHETLLEQLVNKVPDWKLDENKRILFKYDEDAAEFKEILSRITEEYKKQNQIRSDSEKLLLDLNRSLQLYQQTQKTGKKPAQKVPPPPQTK